MEPGDDNDQQQQATAWDPDGSTEGTQSNTAGEEMRASMGRRVARGSRLWVPLLDDVHATSPGLRGLRGRDTRMAQDSPILLSQASRRDLVMVANRPYRRGPPPVQPSTSLRPWTN